MKPARPEPTPVELFRRWLDDRHAPPRHVYWTGHLAREAGEFRNDRAGHQQRFHARDPAARAVADAALAAEAEGRVLLTQGRLGPGQWAYVATKAARPGETA